MLSVGPVHGLGPGVTTASQPFYLPLQLSRSPPPTPTSQPAAYSIVQATKRNPGGCKVPQCRIVDCRLLSHARFRRTEHQRFRERAHRHDISHTAIRPRRFRTNRPTRIFSDRDLSHSDLGEPLHRFFTDMFEPELHDFRRAFATIVPAFTFDTSNTALSSEPFCIALTLLACINNAISHQYLTEVRTAMVLYTKALAGFRSMLASIQFSSDSDQIELALVVVSILMSYDALYAKLHELKLHRHGMQRLVQSRGGLDHLTISLPYVLHFDRLSATMLNTSPAFSRQATPDLRSYLPSHSTSTYGSKFSQMYHQSRWHCNMRTLEYCERTGNLLRLFESLSREQTPENENGYIESPTGIENFLSERDRVDEEFAAIHGLILVSHSMDMYILLASRIVEYSITWTNRCPTYTRFLIEKLYESVRTIDLNSQWSEQTDLLRWVLFVMAIFMTDLEGRSAVVAYLQELIGARYDNQVWPRDWREEELANLRGFVWCDRDFGQRYDTLCRELEGASPI